MQRRPYLAVGWFWYVGTLVPVIGLIQVGGQGLADRYTYIPLVGIFLMAVWGSTELATRWRFQGAAWAGAGAVLLLLVLLTRLQVAVWHDSISLWQYTVDVDPTNPVAQYNLGVCLANRNRAKEAIPHFQKMQQLLPEDKSIGYHLGLALARAGKVAEALQPFEEYLKNFPENADGHYNLALALAELGRRQEAIPHLEKALAINPDYDEAHYSLGNLLELQGRPAESLFHFREAIRRQPNLAKHHWALAFALQEHGDLKAAVSEFETARRLDPNWPQTYSRIAWSLSTHPEAKARNGTLALKLAQEVFQAAGSGSPGVLDTLAAAYAETGQFKEAEATLRQALDLAVRGHILQMVPPMEERLRLYQAGQPFRDKRQERKP
jgi:tetratricopeptide (TPR) repeat protein